MATHSDLAYLHYKHQGYQISDQEQKAGDPDVQYYGFTDSLGNWYIMEENLSPGGGTDPKTWRFIKGSSGFSTNWANRESLSYDTFYNTFK